ncbi:hypothetical protein [Phenylobacterium sp.]|uniref:hypothetical protein n=1 Tax=Phenylobacterium sp. TaxID=1871053 RepID=UPI0025E481FE|nr:hypothetical protein [Phenylobacterium sp.]MBX3482441.1 hypothetical protein [Phenylobacterium sp.]
MKVTVSLPDAIFEDAEALVATLRTSRSDVYARALAEFVGHHAPERVTALMNRVVEDVGAEDDAFSRAAARRALGRTEW